MPSSPHLPSVPRGRYVELVTKVLARYSNQLLTKTYLSWAATTKHAIASREQLAFEAAARMSGRGEMVLQLHFGAWRDVTYVTKERKVELARKMYARYQHQALTKVYLAWSAYTAFEAAHRQAQSEKALAFWSGKQEMLLKVYWEAFKDAVAASREAREDVALQALTRMRHGLMHVAFAQWVQLVEMERGLKQPAGGAVSAEMAEQLKQISAAVAEMRAENASRDAAVEAASVTAARIEKQLGQTATMLHRSEKLLAPLPAAAVDQAAYAMMRNEVQDLHSQLSTTRDQMFHMNLAKAGRSELMDVRGAVQRFIFGAEAPHVPMPPPPPPPPPPRLPAEVPLAPDAFTPDGSRPQTPMPVAAGGGGGPPEPTPAADSPRRLARQPRPPSAQRTLSARARPATARTGIAAGVAVATGGDATLHRRPQSARESSVMAAYGGAKRELASLAGLGTTWDGATPMHAPPPATPQPTQAPAAPLVGGGSPRVGTAFVEVTDLTELFEEKGASQRRQAGGRGGMGRPQSARGGRGGGTNRFPLMGS